jgi:6,7-dimethyl-8-ribityllumazine synthase
MREFVGQLQAPEGARVCIVISRFNELVGRSLLQGAIDGLRRCGIDEENIDVVWVPGAFELPAITRRIALSTAYQGIICLGAVIRGATAHFDFVAGTAANGVAQVAAETGLPIAFEVLTTDSIEQALERAGTKAGNKGFDGALVVVEMMNLNRQLGSQLSELSQSL